MSTTATQAGSWHHLFVRALCDSPTWNAGDYVADQKLRDADAVALQEQRWSYPPFDELHKCVSRWLKIKQARKKSSSDAAMKLLLQQAAQGRFYPRFKLQSSEFLESAPIGTLGIDGSILCGGCIGNMHFHSTPPLCINRSFYEEQASPIGTRQLWWLGNEEYAAQYHGDPFLGILDRHIVGSHVARLMRSTGATFADVVRLLTGPRYYERNLLHGALWQWIGCAPSPRLDGAAVLWKQVALVLPNIEEVIQNIEAPAPWVNDSFYRPGRIVNVLAAHQRLNIVHGIGHGFLYYFIRTDQQPLDALYQALNACGQAPEELKQLYKTSFVHYEGPELHHNCACGVFHSFFNNLSPELVELPVDMREVMLRNTSTWGKICPVLLKALSSLPKGAHMQYHPSADKDQCYNCGYKNSLKVIEPLWKKTVTELG